MTNREKRVDILSYLIIILICLIPRVVLALYAIPVRTPSDEFSTMFFSSYLAGYDWTDVESYANYYGFGMNLFIWWIMKLPITVMWKYKFMLIFCAVLQALTGWIAFNIIKHTTGIRGINAILLSIASSYMVCTRNTIYYNENALILISWILSYLLMKIVLSNGDTRERNIYSVLAILMMLFALTIHTRALTYIVAFVVTYLVYLCISGQKRWHAIPILLISLLIGYFFVKRIAVDSYINLFWKIAHRTVSNNQINIAKEISFNLIKGTIIMGFGQIGTVMVSSAGVVIIGIYVIISKIFTFLRRRLKENATKENEIALISIGSFMLISVLITVVYQGMSWGENALSGITNGRTELYVYKCYTYIRYMGPYLGPIFLIGAIALVDRHKKQWYIMLGLTYSIIMKLWMIKILPIIYNNVNCSEAFICWKGNKAFDTGIEQYVYGFLIIGLFFVILLIMACFERYTVTFLIVIVLLGYQYIYNAKVYDLDEEKVQYVKINASTQLIKSCEDMGIYLKKDLYVDDEILNSDHQFYYVMQIYLEDYIVHPGYPDKSDENLLIITNDDEKTLTKSGLKNLEAYQLDDNEYILTNNNGLVEYLKTGFED